jgi:hypothetical protein
MIAMLDAETTAKLIQTAIIAGIGLGLFFGLKGRILKFAQWARLPRLDLTPVRIAIRYTILVFAALLAANIDLEHQLKQSPSNQSAPSIPAPTTA